MPIYKHKIQLNQWKPVYFNSILDSLRAKTGCGELEKISDDGFIQAAFYDASFLNNDKMAVTVTFVKTLNGSLFTFIAISDYVKWFDWDKSTETSTIQKYARIFEESFKPINSLPNNGIHPRP